MKSELFPTQVEDVAKIAASTDLPNFSKTGTGKTLTSVGAISAMKLQGGLIVCPPISTRMWKKVLEHELGARVNWLQYRDSIIDRKADFIVCSYGVVAAQFPELYARNNGALIIDEAHHAKNPESQIAHILFGPEGDGLGGLYETSQQFWPLTATPIRRYADDLWTLLRSGHPEVLSSIKALEFREWQRQFCSMALKEINKVKRLVTSGNQNTSLLNTVLYDWIGCIRRTKKEVASYMKPVSEVLVTIEINLSKELVNLLAGKSLKDLIRMIETKDPKIISARRMLGILKIKNSVDAAVEFLREEQGVLGYYHTDVGIALHEGLKRAKLNGAIISGATSGGARERIKESFIAGNLDYIVGQIGAMGESLDGLQKASSMMMLIEDDWSDATVEQFQGRLDRIGQTNPVTMYLFQADHELEEAIYEVRMRKRSGASQVLDQRT